MDDHKHKELIKVHDLKKWFQTGDVITKALNGLTFEIGQGEFVAIMGPSGSGKSTLMHILGFLDRPTDGEYFYKKQNLKELDDDELALLRNSEIGFVFQAFNLLPRTSVFDNVKMPLLYSKHPAKNHNKMTEKAVKAVGLWKRKDNLSNQLSGGEKQRVAIARALVSDPSIIFADEPTGNLDSKTGGQIMSLIEELNDQGKTIILVTHEKNTAEHAERIIFMRDGLIEKDFKVTNRLTMKDGGDLAK
jgi:putative ABC transport system ATP-binding protein